ncbi:ABC transporter ATP-binding protein [Sporosarcina siberiensis]|uniref:ABC transporter ATP-binding protein n=1 Tax=Sporosarcina siberiensis TaxID=1365606 RepID=A0ABW4SFA2_9BACL
MKSVISFTDVSLRRNGQAILKGINWDINSNEHWAILGLNGSGKTSLLNIVSGYHFPTTGDVSVLGNKFGKTSLPELRKKIGFVSSSLDRFSQLVNNETIEEVVVSGKFASFGLYEHVSEEDYKKASSLIELMRLSYLKGKSFQFLSQGEKRRVLIARALMSNPEILILDEPCSGLDILSREQLLAIMKDVKQNNCHIIYVTHHIEELVKELTHVLLLHNGEIVAAGPKKEVLIDTKLSKTFEVPVKINWKNDRPWLTL